MDIPVVRVAGISAASREAIAADGSGIVFTAGAGAVRLEIGETGDLNNPQFFHLPRKRLHAANSSQRFPWEKQQGPVVIGESCSEDAKAKAKDKVNNASCVVASPSAIAVGETGYLPRVIVYSKMAQPLAVIQEHQFGVQHLQFSPSGRYLATLGTPNDGYLYVWEIDMDAVSSQAGSGVSLHSSNRCISQVHDIQWISDTQLVTVGVRHIRVWTVEPGVSNGVLAGRNVVLGAQADATFECAVKLEGSQTGITGEPGSPGGLSSPFLVATRSGSILKVGGSISTVLETDMTVSTMAIHGNELVVAGDHVCKYDLATFEEILCDVGVTGVKSVAIGSEVIFLTATGLVTEMGKILRDPLDEPIVGMRSSADGKLVSWSGRTLKYWTDQLTPDTQIELEVDINVLHSGKNIVAGSSDGLVAFDGEVINAHAGPVTDVDSIDDLVVSAGRDRCLQIWRKLENSWNLQTLPLLGPLTRARIVNPATIVTVVGNKTVQLHRLVGDDFVTEKTIMSKVLILDLCVFGGAVFLSTSDRQVLVYDAAGELQTSYRPLDVQQEPVALSHIQPIIFEGEQYLVAAAVDKSVCVYSHPEGQLLAAEWAHATPIKGIVVCADRIISYGDLIVERRLAREPERASDSRSPVRSLSPVRSVRSSSPIRRPASPLRQSQPVRAPSPTRAGRPTTPTRPSALLRAASPKRVSPPVTSRSPRAGAVPLRLSSPRPNLSSQAVPAVRPVESLTVATEEARTGSVVESLEHALEAYIASNESAPKLQPLLASAFAKSGAGEHEFSLLAEKVTGEIMQYVRRRFEPGQ